MEDPGNKGTTVSLNKPINIFSQKEFGCYGMDCLYRIYTNLVYLVVLMFLFNQFYLVSVAGKFPAIII